MDSLILFHMLSKNIWYSFRGKRWTSLVINKQWWGRRTGIAHSVVGLHTPSRLWVPPMLEYTCTSTWIHKKAWLSCWPSRGQQVLHHGWIWGSHCTQVTKHKSKGSPGFETPGQTLPKVQAGLSVTPQKGPMSSKNFKKEKNNDDIYLGSNSLIYLTEPYFATFTRGYIDIQKINLKM